MVFRYVVVLSVMFMMILEYLVLFIYGRGDVFVNEDLMVRFLNVVFDLNLDLFCIFELV